MAGKIIPEMVQQGAKLVVVTYDVCGHWNIGVPIYTVPVFSQKQSALIDKIPVVRKLDFLRQERGYFEELFIKVSDIIKKHDIDVVFSFSNPQASNILGAIIRKRLGVKFISHFSDPWYDNPYRAPNLLQSAKIFLQERYVVKWSDKIVFTNDQALHLVMKKYPRYFKKAFVIPHCFSRKDYPESIKENDGKFVISHIGVFYKQRTPETLFKSVKNIMDAKPDIAQKLKISLVGATDEYSSYGKNELETLVKKYGMENTIEILPRVDYKKSLQLMKESDCLVVIDAPGESSPFLPSKIIDYAGSGTTIFGITPKSSPTAEFLKKANFRSFDHDETENLSSHICDLVAGKRPNAHLGFIESYTVESVVRNLLDHFKTT